MKDKKLLFLFIFIIFLTACNEKVQISETNSKHFLNYDNIKIKIVDNIDEKESIYTTIIEYLQIINDFSPIENIEIEVSKQYIVPNTDKMIKCDVKFIDTEEFKKELVKKSYGIYDNWISEGLYGKIFGQDEIIDFPTYYTNNDFSLFGARFFEPFASKEEIENVKSASRDLVEYILKDDKKEELLKNNIEISYIEAWANKKGIDPGYQREIESLMNRMEMLHKIGQLIIDTKEEINGFEIDISTAEINEQYNTAEKVEQLILRFDRDILAIKKGIEKDAPKFYSEYKEVLNNVPKLEYIFDTYINGYAIEGYVHTGYSQIYLGNMMAQSHEYCHFLFHNPFTEKDIVIKKPNWLDEGIANYLDVAYSEAYIEGIGYNFHIISNPTEDIVTKTLMETLTEDEINEVQNLDANLLNIYIENNIDINNIEEIKKDKNKRVLENHLRSLSKIKFNKILGSKLKEEKAPLDLMIEGDTMDYHKNFSFFSYLVEEYGLDKMLYLNVTNFNGLTYKDVFGKIFEELKVDWMSYLKENIKGIESIL